MVEAEVEHCPLILIILSYFLLVDFLLMRYQVAVVVPTNHPSLEEDLKAQNCLFLMVHFLEEVELDLELLLAEDLVVEVHLEEVDRNSTEAYSMKMI